MRLLHTSDWHLGRSLFEYSLLQDQQAFLDRLVVLIEEREVDAVLIAGDIYDRPVPSAQAVRLYDDFLTRVVAELRVPVLAIAGNHDSASRLEFGSSLYRGAGYHIAGQPVKTIQKAVLEKDGTLLHVHLLPYLHPADVRALLADSEIRTFDDAYRAILEENTSRLEENACNILMAHGFFSMLGASSGDKAVITSDSELNIGGIDIADAAHFAPFDYVALGHLHAPQWTQRERVRYSGSPLKYSLSEERQSKSVTLLDIEGKAIRTEVLPVPPLREVRTVSGKLTDLLDPAFHRDNPDFDDYVFAEIQGEEVPFAMEKLRALFPRLLGLSFSASRHDSSREINLQAKREKLSTEELFLRFYREIRGHEPSSEQRRLIQETIRKMETEPEDK